MNRHSGDMGKFLREPIDVTKMLGSWAKFLFFVGGLLYSFFALKAQVDKIPAIQDQTTRIEHYLSGKDPQYWKEINQIH